MTPDSIRALLGKALVLLVLAFPLALCAEPGHDPLILVSIDGFHPDYLKHGRAPTLSRLAREGVHARWMNPSYPSLTFPNHYTLVTGLRPDRHGIVSNDMYDPQLGRFGLRLREAVADGRWWGGEPLWVGVRKAGGIAATMFWPGSEAQIDGFRPNHWFAFDGSIDPARRVDTVLGWLDLPEAERPRLITLYFDQVDHTGHDFGPDAPELIAAVAEVDAALRRLLEGLTARGLRERVNLVIVSDHGMAEVAPERVERLDDLIDPSLLEVVSEGPSLLIAPKPGAEQAARAALLGRHGHLQCWDKTGLPERWHYGRHPRVPAIVCQDDTGWRTMLASTIARWSGQAKPGAHGYDPFDRSMRALFVAQGPAFARGARLKPFDNVHVYPLLVHLLGIPPAPNDGDPTVLAGALRAPDH